VVGPALGRRRPRPISSAPAGGPNSGDLLLVPAQEVELLCTDYIHGDVSGDTSSAAACW
jgi:hypothetical protein